MFMENNRDTVSPVAQHIIEKCGGTKVVAEICGKQISTIAKWKYPRNREGRGGIVPPEDAQKLLNAAREGLLDLTPDDFFEPIPEAS